MKAITIRYLGPTSSRGSRLKADDGDGNSVTIPFPYELDRHEAYRSADRALCTKMDWTGTLCLGWGRGCAVCTFVSDFDTFEV